MSKEIIIVYQDCFMCGSRENWSAKAKHVADEAEKAGIPYRKLSFATMEGQDHCAKAVENGIKTMPFFTDGKIYAQDYETLLEAELEPQAVKIKATAEPKKTKKTKKEANDESVQEA